MNKVNTSSTIHNLNCYNDNSNEAFRCSLNWKKKDKIIVIIINK